MKLLKYRYDFLYAAIKVTVGRKQQISARPVISAEALGKDCNNSTSIIQINARAVIRKGIGVNALLKKR